MLGEQHADDLAPGEAQGLQRGDVTLLSEHPAAGRVGDGEGRGHESGDAEEREQHPEQPVVQGHGGLDLAPGGYPLHLARELGDRALDDQ